MTPLKHIIWAILLLSTTVVNAAQWPDLLNPAPAIGGGEKDAAVILAIENYPFVSSIPGARHNANAWYDYLSKTRGISPEKIVFQTDTDVTAEDMKAAAGKAAAAVGEGGTLWYIFIGHGAPSSDGKQGLLVGVDAQQKVESLNVRSLGQNDLAATLINSKAASIILLVDACFSGRSIDGSPLIKGLQPIGIVPTGLMQDPRLLAFAGAGGKEFAGQLPGGERPAFSYLALGGLRGWADADQDGAITAEELRNYTDNVMRTLVTDRTQTPQLQGDSTKVLSKSPREKAPDLAQLAKDLAGNKDSPFEFKISALANVPTANAPAAGVLHVPQAQMPEELSKKTGIDFSGLDVNALEKYNAVILFEKGDAPPLAKRQKWLALGKQTHAYSEISEKRAGEWFKYAEDSAVSDAVQFDGSDLSAEEKSKKWAAVAKTFPNKRLEATERQKEWDRYASELTAIAKAKKARRPIMKQDYKQLRRLLSLSVVTYADKQGFAVVFADTYGKTYEDNPFIGELTQYLPDGYLSWTEKQAIAERKATEEKDHAMSDMAFTPSGTFLMDPLRYNSLPTSPANNYIYAKLASAGTDLGALSWNQSGAEGISSDGSTVVGWIHKNSNTQKHAFKYVGGTMTDIGTLGGTDSEAYAASSDGSVIVGFSDKAGDASQHAFKYSGGIMTDLGTLGGTYSTARDVSSDGSVIVGLSKTAGNIDHAFKYSGGAMSDLGTLGGTTSGAEAVSHDGTIIVGYSDITGNTAKHAFSYSGGAFTDLGTLGGTNSWGHGISGDGAVIIGDSEVAIGNTAYHAFKYASGVMTDLGTLGGTNSTPLGASLDGSVIVGYSDTIGNTAPHAFRYSNGTLTDLGTFGGTKSWAYGVSADGQVIVGTSWLTGDAIAHAFIYRTRMVDVDNTKNAISLNGRQLNSLINLKTSMLAESLASDCSQFSSRNHCFSYGSRRVEGEDKSQTALSFKYAYRFKPTTHAGILLDQNFATSYGNFRTETGAPLIGAFVVFDSNEDGTGTQFKMAGAFNSTYLQVTRSVLSNTEAGKGKTDLLNGGFLAELGYGFRLHNTWAMKPYTGFRYTEVTREAYTETTGADFPIKYEEVSHRRATAIAGLRTGGMLTKHLGINLGGGLEQDISYKADNYKGTINMISSFDLDTTENRKTRGFAEMNAAYKFTETKSLNIGVGLARPMLNKGSTLTARLNYTVGF